MVMLWRMFGWLGYKQSHIEPVSVGLQLSEADD